MGDSALFHVADAAAETARLVRGGGPVTQSEAKNVGMVRTSQAGGAWADAEFGPGDGFCDDACGVRDQYVGFVADCNTLLTDYTLSSLCEADGEDTVEAQNLDEKQDVKAVVDTKARAAELGRLSHTRPCKEWAQTFARVPGTPGLGHQSFK